MKQCANPKCHTFFTPKSVAHSFCSDECRRSVRGSDYRKARLVALLRDGYACTECGLADQLECHHKQPVSKGGDHSLSNLQTLCRKCHKTKHRKWRVYGNRQSEEYGYAA